MLPNNVANNVQGTQSSKEKLKLIQYFKDKIGLTEVWVPQETNYDSKVEQKWQEDLKVMFSFLKKKTTNTSVVLTVQFGKETFTIKKPRTSNFNSSILHSFT